MTKYSLTRRVPYSMEQVFKITGDVANYKEFVPLVKKSIVRNKKALPDGRTTFDAEIAVAYSKLGIHETMTSKVTVDPLGQIVKSHCSDGPVKSLDSEWKLVKVDKPAAAQVLRPFADRCRGEKTGLHSTIRGHGVA